LPTKDHIVKVMISPVVMYRYQSWTTEKATHQGTDTSKLWCWRRLLRDPWTARRSSQSILKSILNIHWKDWFWSYSTLATWCKEATHWKRTWCWERLRAGGDDWGLSGMPLASDSSQHTRIMLRGRHSHEHTQSVKGKVSVAQSCSTFCGPVDSSPPDFCVRGILQARILEWVAISFSRGSSQPRDRICVSCVAGRFFTIWATRKPWTYSKLYTVPRIWF